MLKFSATNYSIDKHSALLKFSRFCCEQSAEGSALWLLKLSATKYSANEHSAFLGFSRFRSEQSTKGFALLEKSVEGYFAEEIVIRNSIAMMKAFLWLL